MSERYSIGIEFVGRDDASDEIRSVAEGLQKLGEANEQVVARAKEVVRSAREERTVLRAVQEEAQVFGERSQFVARQLGEVAGFASTVSKMITALDTSFTRLNTAQLALASAQERQREILRELNELYGIQATNLKEAEEALRRMLESGEASGRSAEALKESLRKVKDAQKELASASAEVEKAVQSMNAQIIAVGVSSLELVPKFMSVVNGISALVAISPTLSSALGALRAGFAALYASMGPLGLALLAVGTAAAVIAANWESIAPVFEQVASSVQSVLSPALDWLRVNVLEPLASLLGNVVIVGPGLHRGPREELVFSDLGPRGCPRMVLERGARPDSRLLGRSGQRGPRPGLSGRLAPGGGLELDGERARCGVEERDRAAGGLPRRSGAGYPEVGLRRREGDGRGLRRCLQGDLRRGPLVPQARAGPGQLHRLGDTGGLLLAPPSAGRRLHRP
jgi:predicted  nucleic acid-binding Zn-ribbon protein